MKVLNILFLAAGILALVGCGAATATPSVSSSTPTPVDMAGAQRTALELFVEDPALAGHWVPCSNYDDVASACPLSVTVKARLAGLRTGGYFADTPPGVCGEDYISGTQNGFNNAPQVLSAVVGANGGVTVVIQRAPGRSNLTAVMTETNGTWLASDLASGTGPSASIFSAKPNC